MNIFSGFKRVTLFILTNILVMVTLSIAFNVICAILGVSPNTSHIGSLLIFALIWGMGGSFISLMISKFMAKRAMGVQIIEPNTLNPEEKRILNTVYQLAQKAGLKKMPEVGIYESPDINAFATGPSKNNSLVALSTGLLRSMTPEEVEGVIGHELAHIANGDMVTLTLIQGVVNAFAIFLSRIIANVLASQVDERKQGIVYFISHIVLEIVFTVLGSILVSYFSRKREFRADAGGAQYAGRKKMIAGLKRLQSQFQRLEPEPAETKAFASLKISSRGSGFMALFSTHPPLEERIRRLEESAMGPY